MKVPFVDLKVQYESIKDEIQFAINQVLGSAAFAGGPFVAAFEEQFAAFCGVRHAVGVGSGTEAIWLTLLALGIGPGDEVITVPNTFIATAEAISFCGAKPVFVDIEEASYAMNADLLDQVITPKTKAIIPVHIFGQTADMDPIREIAAKHGLFVIEDACQAHGARYKGQLAGSLGMAGCFSFYPGKNLGAYGEAGAVTTNDNELAEKIRTLRDHGQQRKYHHGVIGWNGRMDGLQGAILSVKLKHIDAWNDCRRKNAGLYAEHFKGDASNDIVAPIEVDNAKHVYHVYAVRTKNRDVFMDALGKKGIATGIHYPVPLHLTDAYRKLGYKAGDFPIAEDVANQLVSLPMFPELSEEQISYVASEAKAFFASSAF
ncbi:MAG: dTDP-3-amino-3,6-dideoxy-alpha-D-galactopyranose transaminase [Syntrophorhabdus sp. PtaU1.Bin050]|nr:MAG: dTDP-3-amino-3,6-dideoxy-alpha-D-galactopyranose transaminase [Syntrophorhabdus sp. PtaU1.Bin050]